MNPWDELVTAALVGTERGAFSMPAMEGAGIRVSPSPSELGKTLTELLKA